jgi:hypothetical protein
MAMTPDIHDLPDIRVVGTLPLMQLRLSPQKYTRVLNLAATFENIVAVLAPPPPVNEPQQPLLTTANLQSAQQRLQKAVTTQRNVSDTDPDSTLDLAALVKIMPTLKDAQHLMAQLDLDGSVAQR